MAIYYVKRDNMGNVTDAEAQRYARLLARAIGHDVEWADHSGCGDCTGEERREHEHYAQWVYDDGAWWTGHD